MTTTKKKSKKPSKACLRNHPLKKGSKGPSDEPVTTHKKRANWFQARASWPYRELSATLIANEKARAAMELQNAGGQNQWIQAGPTNIGGRMTSIVSHPDDADKIVAGAAGGGVWRSHDAGLGWEPLWHDHPTLNIGALTLDPSNPDTIYCGTGEANLSADSHPGVGVYRSVNFGDSWQLLASAEVLDLPTRIGALAVDPSDPNHIRLGGLTHSFGGATGMYVSRDGGISWALDTNLLNAPHFCHAVVFCQDNEGVLFTTITANGANNGIWRSSDGGETWGHLTSGLPTSSRIGRTSLAIALSEPDTVYAVSCVAGSDALLGVFKSIDGGDTWSNIAGQRFRSERQMFYNNTLAVHPENPDIVIWGGVDLHRTSNGGSTWSNVTRWNAERGASNYAHADQHALMMPAAAPGRVYAMNDGGMDISENSGRHWENRSNGLATNMFYDLEVAGGFPDFYGGGAQDNGTIVTLEGDGGNFVELTGGDGGWMVIDPNNANHLFASSQGMNIYRFTSSMGWKNVSPPEDRYQMWMVFIAMDPVNPKTLFTGSRRVWRTKNDGIKWIAVSANLDNSDITCLEIAPADHDRIYVGTENGAIFRSVNGGGDWEGNLASTVLPGHTVTRIKTHPSDADTVYATVANIGNSHFFRSLDGGLSWEDLDLGALPDVPHHSLAISKSQPETIYVCNDVGVYVSSDGGFSWMNLTRNLPNVIVVDLVLHEDSSTLFAATYGRSIWKISV